MSDSTCSIESCDKSATRRGWCAMHYQRWRIHGDPNQVIVRVRKICAFETCDRRVQARGLCWTHDRQRSTGKPLTEIRSWRSQSERDEYGRKLCRKCLEWLPESEFSRSARHSDGLTYLCKRCATDKHRLENYGITAAQYDALLSAQGGGCAICGEQCSTGRMLAVDHDHECCPDYIKTCGECTRGLLCGSCNQGLGKLGDDPERLIRAARYVSSHREANPSARRRAGDDEEPLA